MNAQRLDTRPQSGFSLLEMMIAVVILGVITSQLFLVLTAQRNAYRGESTSLDVQETTRLVLDLMSFDTRNAGMLIPRELAVASVDGGSNASDRFCSSDGTIFQIPGPGGDNEFWNNLDHTFPGAVGTVSGPRLTLTSLDIESGLNSQLAGGLTNDFLPNAGVIVAKGVQDANGVWSGVAGTRKVFCARVQNSTVGSGQPAPGGTVVLDQAPPTDFSSGQITAIPAVIYEVQVTPGVGGEPDTVRLLRNNIAISDQIEDLQVQYWVDDAPTNGAIDGTNEWPLDTLDGKDTSRIRRVRLYALGRTAIDDPAGLDRHHNPGMANRVPDPRYDSLKREVFVASVLPRNMFDYLFTPNGTVANVP